EQVNAVLGVGLVLVDDVSLINNRGHVKVLGILVGLAAHGGIGLAQDGGPVAAHGGSHGDFAGHRRADLGVMQVAGSAAAIVADPVEDDVASLEVVASIGEGVLAPGVV